MVRHRITAVSTLVAGLALLGLFGASAVAAGHSKQPRIVAKPDDVMVNARVKLRGTGFAPNSTFTVAECGETSWSLPQDPCSAGNAVTVTTDGTGVFHAKIVAKLCPQDSPPTITQETCYVGARVVTGIDTLALRGAASIMVSWP